MQGVKVNLLQWDLVATQTDLNHWSVGTRNHQQKQVHNLSICLLRPNENTRKQLKKTQTPQSMSVPKKWRGILAHRLAGLRFSSKIQLRSSVWEACSESWWCAHQSTPRGNWELVSSAKFGATTRKMGGIIHQLIAVSITINAHLDPKDMPESAYGSVSKPCTPGEHQNSW